MASLRQLAAKIKTFEDFSKVVNIQKIVIMKDIAKLKTIIKQLSFRDMIFNNLIIDLHKKHGSFDPSFFDAKKSRIPFKRDLHFVMSSGNGSSLDNYSNKLILDFVKKEHNKRDMYIVIGNQMGEMLKKANLHVSNILGDAAINQTETYERIAAQVLRGYEDMMFVKATFLFFEMESKTISEIELFPFHKKKREFDKNELEGMDIENNIIQSVNTKHITWIKDLDIVSQKIAHFAVQEKSYYVMTKYRLNAKLREMASLDDKEKNIREEIEIVRTKMHRKRQESVTNELLTNAVAFGAINGEEEDG